MKKFTLLISFSLVLILVGMLSFSCSSSTPSTSSAAPSTSSAAPPTSSAAPSTSSTAPSSSSVPAAPKEILVGTVEPLTGMYAGFGQGGEFGMQAAVDDINAQGGILVKEYNKKIPVKLIVLNSESDPTKSGPLAQQLIVNDNVQFLLAPDEPPPMHAPISTVSTRYKVPLIIGGGPLEPWNAARQGATDQWPYTWMIGFGIATPPPQGDFRYNKPGYTIKSDYFQELDAYAAQTNKTMGIFCTDDPDGKGWYGLFPGMLKDYGMNVIGVDKNLGLVPIGTTDFSSMIEQWKSNNVQLLWGNAPGADFGAMWKQARALGFEPKIVTIGKAPLFYTDASSWGDDLCVGVGTEVWWSPSYTGPGIGNTTPATLAQRWTEAKNQPVNRGIGHGYAPAQVLFDAIQRAGTLDGTAVNNAIAQTNMNTINYQVQFDQQLHFSWIPLFLGQWQKTNTSDKWDCPIVFSQHDFLPAQAKFEFPVPY